MDIFWETTESDERIVADLRPGVDIGSACSEAVKLAQASCKPVSFTFNGMPLVAQPTHAPETLVRKYCDTKEKQAEAAEAEREYNRHASCRDKFERLQRRHAALLSALETLDAIGRGGVIERRETGKPTWYVLEEIRKVAGGAIDNDRSEVIK